MRSVSNVCSAEAGEVPDNQVNTHLGNPGFRDRTFDAVLSIGGFNHFNDPEGALREMVRVVRPGATIVLSDELPDLTDRMLFRKLGLPGLDRWIVARLMNLGYEYTDLVERHREAKCHHIPITFVPPHPDQSGVTWTENRVPLWRPS